MTNAALQVKLKQRLNKLDSSDYDNIEDWQLVEAFNKAQIRWARKQIGGLGKPQGAPLDEGSKLLTDDLQRLITPALLGLDRQELRESATLPGDYLSFKRISAAAKTSCCPARPLVIRPCEEANVDIWLRDENHKPSFEWGETFYSLSNGQIHLYTGGEFTLKKVVLNYYREPRPIEIVGVLNLKTEQLSTQEVTCEFSDGVAELILDLTVGILAGDLENITQYQRAQQDEALNS